jgi:hypothetical protein
VLASGPQAARAVRKPRGCTGAAGGRVAASSLARFLGSLALLVRHRPARRHRRHGPPPAPRRAAPIPLTITARIEYNRLVSPARSSSGSTSVTRRG